MLMGITSKLKILIYCIHPIECFGSFTILSLKIFLMGTLIHSKQ